MIPKLLLLAGSVPPGVSAVASVVGNLARQFGRDEMVLLGPEERDAPPETWRDEWPRIFTHRRFCNQMRRGNRWFRKLAVPGLYRRTLGVARSQGCRSVMAVFPTEEHLLVGALVARRLGVPFYPYLHNTYLDQRAGFERWIARRLQPRVFARARHVFVISDGMLALFHRRYPELEGRCSALRHPFSAPVPPAAAPPPVGERPHFLMIGNLNASNEDAASRLFRVVARVPGSRLTVLGPHHPSVIERLGLRREGVRVDRVSRDVLLDEVRAADALLLPHGLDGRWSPVEYETMFPTKTIEYLFSGRPILAHTPPDCFLTRFLRSHGCAVVVDRADEEELEAAVRSICRDPSLRERVVRGAVATAAMFHAAGVAAHLREVLDDWWTPSTAAPERRAAAR